MHMAAFVEHCHSGKRPLRVESGLSSQERIDGFLQKKSDARYSSAALAGK